MTFNKLRNQLYIAMMAVLILTACNTSEKIHGEADPALPMLTGDGEVNRSTLTYQFLMQGDHDTLVDFSNYAVPAGAAFPSNTFEGKLTLRNPDISGRFREVKDLYGYTDSADVARMHLPSFDYEFVQSGSHIIPVKRGYIPNTHPSWEYILEPGRVWDEKNDKGYSRAAIPFTLKQKNQNCVHNGVLMFLFKNDGSTSSLAYQIASETCGYFKFDMWGTVETAYASYEIKGEEEIIKNYVSEASGRMLTKPIAELSEDYPGAQPQEFSAPKEVTQEHMTLYGFVIDSVNYVGGGDTRQGKYPFLEVLNVPSYSTAKSVSAGLGLMRLEKLYPGSRKHYIGDLVPACGESDNWSDVTMENALDMATGNYEVSKAMVDEGARHTGRMFMPEDHGLKINYCCTYYSKKAPAGTQWVYHTSDTYVLGTAINAFLQKETNRPAADYFTDLIVKDIFEPLGISPTAKVSQCTYDSVAQPFSGYGLTYHHDDVAKIANFLNNGAKISDELMLDEDMYTSIMNANGESGIATHTPKKRYDNGFWLLDLKESGMCSESEMIPAMEGYGGIGVYLLPNNTIYYYFSDNYEYKWGEGVKESYRIRPFCNE